MAQNKKDRPQKTGRLEEAVVAARMHRIEPVAHVLRARDLEHDGLGVARRGSRRLDGRANDGRCRWVSSRRGRSRPETHPATSEPPRCNRS